MNALEDTPLAGEAVANLLGLHWSDGQMITVKELNSSGSVTASGHSVCCWVGLGPLSGAPWRTQAPGRSGCQAEEEVWPDQDLQCEGRREEPSTQLREEASELPRTGTGPTHPDPVSPLDASALGLTHG